MGISERDSSSSEKRNKKPSKLSKVRKEHSRKTQKSGKTAPKEKSRKSSGAVAARETSRRGVSKDASKKAVRPDSSKKTVVEQEPSRKGVGEREVSKRGVGEREASRKGVGEKEAPRRGISDKEVTRRGVPDKEVSKKTAGREASKRASGLTKESSRKGVSESSKKSSLVKEGDTSSPLIKDYILHELLGEGSFSTVYRVTKKDNPQKSFACKRYKINERTRRWVDRCLTREMDIALRVRHPKIIQTYEAFYHKDEAFLILEFAPNASVRSHIRKLPEAEYLSEDCIRVWYSDMLAAVAYLHGKEIAHRDIKTDNFLFDQAMTPLLCDFSFACFSPNPTVRFDCMVNTRCGTPIYLAPEVHTLRRGDKYNAKKVDVYALGVCLFELFNKVSPFRGRTYCREELIELQLNQDYAMSGEVQVSATALKLIDLMLEPNPNRRISVNRALMDDWFKPESTKPEKEEPEDTSRYHKFAPHILQTASSETSSLQYNHSISVTDAYSDESLPSKTSSSTPR